MKDARTTAKPKANATSASLWTHVPAPLGVGVVALALLVVTLAPIVTAEDSGELIAAAWHFGIPHPPGYPLWTLLCGLFMHLVPFGEIAWRANLFSADLCDNGPAWPGFCVAPFMCGTGFQPV